MSHYFSRPCNALKSKCICTVHSPKRKKRKKKRYSGHINVQSIVVKSQKLPIWLLEGKMTLDEISNRKGWKRNKTLKERCTIFPLEAVLPKVSFFCLFVLNTRTSFLWRYDTRYVINSRIPLWRQSTITDRNVSARHRGHKRAHGCTTCFAGGYLANPLKLLFF